MLAKSLAACTRLSTTVLSFPVIRTTIAKKSSFLRTPAFIFCLPWGRLCGNHAKRCMNKKTIQCLPNRSQHLPIYIQQFPSYSNRKCKKIAVFTYRSPHFCFPWSRPCDYHSLNGSSDSVYGDLQFLWD